MCQTSTRSLCETGSGPFVEIAFSDVQVSSQYPGGLALRLARVVRYRPDKTVAEAATIDEVRAIAVADGVLAG